MAGLKQFMYTILLVAFYQFGNPGLADDRALSTHQERVDFARNFAQVVINIIRDPKTPYMHRQNILRRSFSESVDIDWIAKFVLGRAWKEATDEQRERYVRLYRRFLTESYIKNFAENPEKDIYTIKVVGVYDLPQESDKFIVHTDTWLTDNTDLKVDYLVHEVDSHYKVQDIAIENVSLIITHRDEFSRLAATYGVDGVIRKLEQALNQDTPTINLSMK